VTHTPGPWHFKPARKHGGYWAAGDAHAVTAEDRGDNWRGYVTGVLANSPNAEANARLIAAAPEMLAALRLVVDLADNEAVESGDCRNPDNPFVVARAAIAKATT
jgi:hypothetical protein